MDGGEADRQGRRNEAAGVELVLQVLQGDPDIGQRLPAAFGILSQTACDHALKLGRQALAQLADRRRLLMQDRRKVAIAESRWKARRPVTIS